MTIVEICNIALVRLGSEKITELTDDTKRAKLCDTLYAHLRKDTLQSHPWRFARKRRKSTSTTTAAFGYSYKHSLPSDYIRMFTDNEQMGKWEIEGKFLLTNSQTLEYIYIAEVTEADFPQYFVSALAARLALEMSYSLVQSNELQDRVVAENTRKLADARFTDSSQAGQAEYPARSFWEIRP